VHTRRISTFLLGAWILGCGLMGFISVRALQSPGIVLNSPPPPVNEIVRKLGYDATAQFIRHAVQEQTRRVTYSWEEGQILLALALGGCLFLATQRRLFALVLCGVMLVLVLFQHIALSPEIAYRGREADFPPGSTNLGTTMRLLVLQQAYFGVEVVKLIAGGLLASYLFVFRTQRRSRKERSIDGLSPVEVD
jgi:uncharacterized membrane protein YphA (DoxX/SURF4 family)